MYALGALGAPVAQVLFLKLLHFTGGIVERAVEVLVLDGLELQQSVLGEVEPLLEVSKLFDVVELLLDDLAYVIEQALLPWLRVDLERLELRRLNVYLYKGRP